MRSIEKTSESFFSHKVREFDTLSDDLKPNVHESATNRNEEKESVRYRKKMIVKVLSDGSDKRVTMLVIMFRQVWKHGKHLKLFFFVFFLKPLSPRCT